MNKKINSLFFIVAIVLILNGIGYGAEQISNKQDLSPDNVILEISNQGAREVISKYWYTSMWEQIIQGISSGNSSWLKVAELLKPGSDAGASSELGVAVFMALEKSPKIVLEIISNNKGYTIDSVCSSNFLIDYPDEKEGTDKILKRINSLKSVSEDNLIFYRNKCLDSLENELQRLSK